jgi:hypothetical protein
MPGAQETAVHWMRLSIPALCLAPPDLKSGDGPPLARRSIRAASAAAHGPRRHWRSQSPPSCGADTDVDASFMPSYEPRNINRLAMRGRMRGAQKRRARDEALCIAEEKRRREPRARACESCCLLLTVGCGDHHARKRAIGGEPSAPSSSVKPGPRPRSSANIKASPTGP